MPELDACHYQVVNALAKIGWLVDPTPLHITDSFGNDFFVDLTAVRPADESGSLEIAVEVKCFALPKKTPELHRAIGQCIVYQGILTREGYTLPVYLAVPMDTFQKYFNDALLAVLNSHGIRLIEIDIEKEAVVQWIT